MRWTSSTVRPRRRTRGSEPMRRSSASVADSGSAVDLYVAVGADDEQPRPFEVAGNVKQEVECPSVGPVQVLEDD